MTRLPLLLVVLGCVGCCSCPPVVVNHKAAAPPNTVEECIAENFDLRQDAGNATPDWQLHIDYCDGVATGFAHFYVQEHPELRTRKEQP